MGFLKVAAADLAGRNLGRDRQHRRAAAVCIEQAVDEMKIAGPARTGTDREPAGDLRFAGGGEGRHLLMPDMDPVDRLPLAQRLGQAVQAVADHAEDTFHTGLISVSAIRSATFSMGMGLVPLSGLLTISVRRRWTGDPHHVRRDATAQVSASSF